MPSYGIQNIMQALQGQRSAARQRGMGTFGMQVPPPIPHYRPDPGRGIGMPRGYPIPQNPYPAPDPGRGIGMPVPPPIPHYGPDPGRGISMGPIAPIQDPYGPVSPSIPYGPDATSPSPRPLPYGPDAVSPFPSPIPYGPDATSPSPGRGISLGNPAPPQQQKPMKFF